MANEFYIQPLENAYVGFSNDGFTPTKTIRYSTNLTTWTSTTVAALQSSYIYVSANQKLYMDSTDEGVFYDTTISPTDLSRANIAHFKVTTANVGDINASFNAGGWINKLFNGNATKITPLMFMISKVVDVSTLLLNSVAENGCAINMFYDCEFLTSAPLCTISNSVGDNAFLNTFRQCYSLSTPMLLNASLLGERCYMYMYRDSGLVMSPELPAIELEPYCYYGMFYNCHSLIAAPNLMATVVPDYAYTYMFQGCSSLVNPPIFNALTVNSRSCQGMFLECTSLVSTPEIHTLHFSVARCFDRMFEGCTHLVYASDLPATDATGVELIYRHMFYGCTSLINIPHISLRTVDSKHFSEMFEGCTALTSVYVYLSSFTSTSSAFYDMFNGCTSIKISETPTSECPNPYRIPMTGTGIGISSTTENMFANTGGTFTGTPELNKTYYTNATLVYGYADNPTQNLIINHLTLAQYQAITPDPHQLYIIDDGLEYETVNNKVTSLSGEVTEDNYPSARAVYNAVVAAQTESADSKEY